MSSFFLTVSSSHFLTELPIDWPLSLSTLVSLVLKITVANF